jgi:uncharacterized membrane protein YfcA
MPVILAILMFLTAIIFSMVGLGGGVLYTPLQIWAGIDFHEAVTTSLFLIMVVSVSASLVYRQADRIDWPLAVTLEAATICGGFAGGLLSTAIPYAVLGMLLAFVVAFAGVTMIRPMSRAKPLASRTSTRFHWARQLGDHRYQVNLLVALPLSFGAGLISGLVGVGGGFLKIPMMVLLFGIPIEIAVGSSALMIGITAAGGFAGHWMNGHWNWRASMLLAAAVFVGGQIGSRISLNLSDLHLKRIFGWFLLAVACLLAAQQLWPS